MRSDAIIIGGSFAGLSAAMYIARARRSVCVIDTGLPRNRFSDHSHGFFTRDGSAPGAMLATARAQVAAYPTARFVDGEAVNAVKQEDGYSVALADGKVLESARLVLAFGIADELPDVPGLAERWGKSVLHCPYCHGFEFSGQRLGVLHVSPMSVHQALLIAEWGPTTLYLNGASEPDAESLAQLEKRGVAIEAAPVKALHGEGSGLSAIELAGGHMADLDALYIGTRTRFNSAIAERLGCELDEAPFGPIIRTDDQKATSVAGVYAAGDITRGAHSTTFASADGVMAGTALHRSLVF
ncbi:NAD(P)/FAD-dependent oxidoreductase [Luteimonas salinilitoris]|uniref:NAD(P)/FAD-dependent oxidoreductase n=1 Tax=Luteimonas salinilitoris TaxID=3237697 RepID=A0ABV4HUD3_9GAMM